MFSETIHVHTPLMKGNVLLLRGAYGYSVPTKMKEDFSIPRLRKVENVHINMLKKQQVALKNDRVQSKCL